MSIRRGTLVTLCAAVLGSALNPPLRVAAETPAQILERIGVTRGLCVVLGDQTGNLAVELARSSELMVYSQVGRDEDVAAARRAADAAGLLGRRLYVEKGDLGHIHLADNLADAVVAIGSAIDAPEAEVLRVLRPQGKALLGSREIIKPTPAGLDDWSHPYHGPDNNPQSKDRVARGPYLTQFLADPRYAPLPQVAVASAGRLFKAFGHVAFKKREEPWLNTLAAFNGFNGTLLWKRDLPPGLMVHRNTIIATPTMLLLADEKSCKRVDAATGRTIDEIVAPADVAGGTHWKWMGLQDGVLYALIGKEEAKDPVERHRRKAHGWPWNKVSKGYNQPDHDWGFARTLFAFNPETKAVLWTYQESEPMDARAMTMKGQRLFAFRFGAYLTCIDTKTGSPMWRKTPENAPELFAALGKYQKRQGWQTNWRTTSYLKSSDDAIYFAGPQIGSLLAVSAKDGRVLWQNPYGNYQLVLREDGLYGLSGQTDKHPSARFDPLTGRILAELPIARRACTRPNGAIDAILFRAQGGSVRLDTAKAEAQLVSPMRAQCQDGVTIANGLLYWWPSVCDCNLTLYGITSLGPAGDYNFEQPATEAERLEAGPGDIANVEPLSTTAADWSTFRADNTRSATSPATVPMKVTRKWQFVPPTALTVTAPVTAGGMVFVSGADGIVRAFDAASGATRWSAYTGGSVRIPPTLSNGRAFVGSGDGWVYAFEARTGRQLWRFRAAPIERKIPVYGELSSTWPAASGVLVEEGVAYVAAGIVNYDGTHVYALDARTGRIKWQNNTSGHLDRSARTGVSVQGPMLLHGQTLYLAGGNAVSPARYTLETGECLNSPEPLRTVQSHSPRGWELFLIGDRVMACGRPYYAHPDYPVYDRTVSNRTYLATTDNYYVTWVNNRRVACFDRNTVRSTDEFLKAWGKLSVAGRTPRWQFDCDKSVAVAVCRNAVVVARAEDVVALDIESGKPLWTHPLPAAPVPWGLAVDRDGRIVLTLDDGRVLCLGG